MKTIDDVLKDKWTILETQKSCKILLKCHKCGSEKLAYSYNIRQGYNPKCKTCFPPKNKKTEPTFKKEDKTFKEISEELNLTENECRSLYQKAMEKMKTECQKEKYKTLRSCLEDLEAEVIDQIKF